jgi:ATP-dependent RNA helicase DeaD
MKFDQFGLKPEILKAIDALGFEIPTPIQAQAIPQLVNGRTDLVGLAQTGTGKTAAFGLPLLSRTDFTLPHLQGLVLCPTRELCLQITSDLSGYARFIKEAKITSVYGGAGIAEQIRQIKKGARIIVATPGRLLDLINRKAVQMGQVACVVLDEADEMFSMGFQEDIDAILKSTSGNRCTWLFSATMPPAVERLARTYMSDPLQVFIGRPNTGADNIVHTCYVVKETDRYAALKRLIDVAPDIYGLIFCRTRQETQSVAEKLMKDGYNAEALHGDLSQEQRTCVMRKYRQRTLQILVATDVAARGLDVEDITHVINYNLPDDAERYTHRSGRTARAGKSGASIVLVNTREYRRIGEIERRSRVRFIKGKIPGGNTVCKTQIASLAEKLVRVNVNREAIEPYLLPVYEALEGLDKQELIQRFVSVHLNHFLEYYRDTADLNTPAGRHPRTVSGADRGPSKSKSTPTPSNNCQSFFINVGRLDNIHEGAIVRLVCDTAGIRSDKIGAISMKREYSFFDVDKRVARKVLNSLKGSKLDNRTIDVRFADSVQPSTPSRRKKESRRRCAIGR